MKIYTRLAIFFILSILLWLVVMGFIFMFTFEYIIPLLSIKENSKYSDVIALFMIIGNLIIGSGLYGWYVGQPIFYIIKSLKLLSEGDFQAFQKPKRFIGETGEIKGIYRLFSDVIIHLDTLAENLQVTERERRELDEFKKEWLAGISHDFKTPLTYITGYSTMLLASDYEWSEEEKNQFVKEIQEKGHHMKELIEDLNLSFKLSNQDIPLVKKEHDLVLFLRTLVLDIANDPSSQNYQIKFISEMELVLASFDEKLLRRALLNLIMNAVIHNPPCEIIILLQVRDSIEIDICDKGKGMDEYTVQNLFQKYFRGTATTASPIGTGLGMTIAQKLLTAHQGTISVKSQIDEGTIVRVVLPFNNKEAIQVI
ncbi:signal transduction histidine kinase [Bacillus sp. SORGH_AS 510]|uniref:sensor histidine kinase n=1 Tax=Bacillus sp. SORGH_AS_0510 TaxID=3041771 RepID=UPI00278377CE|nr:HAMP domain-containing sensor histidine kinase [Bacillus sp. SORGH_AS_0510]MDQ1143865.1 signal transduction histidine kinase [Bacillus sp. SORGH_AS_0510]